LQIVDLSLNPISDTGASAILDLLKKTQSTSLLMINITRKFKISKDELTNRFVISESTWNVLEKQLSLIKENRNIALRIAPLAICYHTKQFSNICKLSIDKNIIKMILIPLLRNQKVRLTMREKMILNLNYLIAFSPHIQKIQMINPISHEIWNFRKNHSSDDGTLS
jgi:hypothetical protein